MSRRDIALGAANKDGGAHVDPKPTREYETIAPDAAFGYYDTDQKQDRVDDAHLVCLRQIAFEILNRPTLLSLAA